MEPNWIKLAMYAIAVAVGAILGTCCGYLIKCVLDGVRFVT